MDYSEVAKIRDVENFSAGAKAVRKTMTSDPYRPLYHFLPPTNYMDGQLGALPDADESDPIWVRFDATIRDE